MAHPNAAFAVIAVLALSGCALMTSPAPLFTVADQPAEPPLAPGLWALLENDCAPDRASGEGACDRIRLSRAADGAWIARDASGQPSDEYRSLFIPVAGPASAPSLLLAEGAKPGETEQTYAVIVPRGDEAPAKRLWLSAIGCNVADAGPPLAALTIERDVGGRVSRCVVRARETALEAARRAALLKLRTLGDAEAVWVGE